MTFLCSVRCLFPWGDRTRNRVIRFFFLTHWDFSQHFQCYAKRKGSKAKNNVLSMLNTSATPTNILTVSCYLFNCSQQNYTSEWTKHPPSQYWHKAVGESHKACEVAALSITAVYAALGHHQHPDIIILTLHSCESKTGCFLKWEVKNVELKRQFTCKEQVSLWERDLGKSQDPLQTATGASFATKFLRWRTV